MWWKYACYVNFVILSIFMWWKYACYVNFVISSISMWWKYTCDVNFVISSVSMWQTDTHVWCKLCGFIYFNVTERHICDVNFVVFSILMWLKYHIENYVIDSIVWHSCNMCHTILFWCFSMFTTHCRLIHNWISILSMPIAPPNSFCCSYICPNF